MLLALAILAGAALALAAGLTIALVRQQTRHNAYTAQLLAAFRDERAALINKVSAPDRLMSEGRPVPKVKPRRTPEQAREYAQIGTVAPPRDPAPDA